MKLTYHFITSILFASILYPFLGLYSLFVFAFGFFIDSDHYLWHIYLKKDFNLIRTYKYYDKKNRKNIKDILNIFHTIEVALLLATLTIISVACNYYPNISIPILIGYVLHMTLDLIAFKIEKIDINIRSPTIIGWMKRNL